MSDMHGNPHYKNAVYLDRDVEIRTIDALLVMAHEQRTANLIAAYQAEVTGQGRIKGDGIAIDRHNEILDRLGL